MYCKFGPHTKGQHKCPHASDRTHDHRLSYCWWTKYCTTICNACCFWWGCRLHPPPPNINIVELGMSCSCIACGNNIAPPGWPRLKPTTLNSGEGGATSINLKTERAHQITDRNKVVKKWCNISSINRRRTTNSSDTAHKHNDNRIRVSCVVFPLNTANTTYSTKVLSLNLGTKNQPHAFFEILLIHFVVA